MKKRTISHSNKLKQAGVGLSGCATQQTSTVNRGGREEEEEEARKEGRQEGRKEQKNSKKQEKTSQESQQKTHREREKCLGEERQVVTLTNCATQTQPNQTNPQR